jgi:catechol 2,3-dioxygenase-like lactoylglutathione lyase family enzyme
VAAFLRLRQVCLVAADLEHAAAKMKQALGLEECYRDPNVAKYGLQNVLFAAGSSFLEIVSPTRPGTTAGRFLERNGRGYMVILDCDDPDRYRKRAEALGVRIANMIRHDAYFGVQLHPKDTGAAMLEFNSTVGGGDLMGPYAPAGPDWQKSVRSDVVRRLSSVEITSPDPAGFASRWGKLLERPVGGNRIELDSGAIRFVQGEDEAFTGVELAASKNATLDLCGLRFRLKA